MLYISSEPPSNSEKMINNNHISKHCVAFTLWQAYDMCISFDPQTSLVRYDP